MNNVRFPHELKHVAEIFTRNNRSVYLVGGAVRDLLRGEKASDWDLATDATPQEVIKMFHRVIPTGIKHGTVTILFGNLQLETTTFRTEATYSDGRHPDSVSFTGDIETDLSRRDFTVNAIALRLSDEAIVDPFGGVADIKARSLRCVGDPAERFAEDGLRPLRAARFVAQLEFDLDEPTKKAISAFLDSTARVAAERIGDEFRKTLRTKQPSRGFRIMESCGLLERLIPELSRCRGVEQKGYHRFDVLDHSFLACDKAPKENEAVRFAALFHDIGKFNTALIDTDGVISFHRHEEESSRLTEIIMRRLRYPNSLIDHVCHLVRQHMFHYDTSWTDAAIRRFIVRVGPAFLDDLYALRRADSFALTAREIAIDPLAELIGRVDSLLAENRALSLKDLAVNGKDLLELGLPSGPRMGIILNELFETVMDDPKMNNRDILLKLAKRIIER